MTLADRLVGNVHNNQPEMLNSARLPGPLAIAPERGPLPTIATAEWP